MASLEIASFDPSFTDPDEAKWHDSVMKSFAYDPGYAKIYEPNAEDLSYCADPDPTQYAASMRNQDYPYNDALHQYMDTVPETKTIRELPWAVRYIFSKGYTPDTAKAYIGEYALRRLLVMRGAQEYADTPAFYQGARAIDTIPFLELMHAIDRLASTGKPPDSGPALVVTEGIYIGKIIEKPEKIRGSISNQLLVTVDVGAAVDKEKPEEDGLRKIVCAGIPVVKKDDLVAVALPGLSTIARHGNGPGGYRTERVRIRGFHVGRRKYRSQAIVLSFAETCGQLGPYKGALVDHRNTEVNEVLRLPTLPGLSPGKKLDATSLSTHGYPLVQSDHERALGLQRRQAIIANYISLAAQGLSPHFNEFQLE